MSLTTDIAAIVTHDESGLIPEEWWGHAKLYDRLGSVFKTTIAINDHHCGGNRTVRSFADAIESALVAGADAIAYINARQLFLDTSILVRAVKEFSSGRYDYYTQHEHSRLPVGCGISIARISSLRTADSQTMAEYQNHLYASGTKYDIRYDDHPYCNYEHARLNAFVNDEMVAAVDSNRHGITWSLSGFTEMVSATGYARRWPESRDNGIEKHVDERHMQSAFGFESGYTANFPSYIMFDLTNKCNAACIHCPQSSGFLGQENTVFLDYDTYCRAIDECVGQTIDFVRITADGEPLLHPRVYDMVQYARDKGVGPVGLTTNGSALNDKNIQRLLNAGLDVIDISLDAFSADVFETVRAGLSYEKTVNNVHRFLELAKSSNHGVKIMVSFVNQKENTHELEAFREYWTPRVDRVLVREMISNVGIISVEGSVEEEDVKRWPCPHWFRRVVVNYDGSVKACPIDWQNGSVCGSLKENTISEIWHNDHYRANRLEHMNNEYSDASICRTCRDWRGTPWNLGYEKVIRDLSSV